jgi:hypothetical protein
MNDNEEFEGMNVELPVGPRDQVNASARNFLAAHELVLRVQVPIALDPDGMRLLDTIAQAAIAAETRGRLLVCVGMEGPHGATASAFVEVERRPDQEQEDDDAA